MFKFFFDRLKLRRLLGAVILLGGAIAATEAATPGTRINTGSAAAVTDAQGNVWAADNSFSGGQTTTSANAISTAGVTNPAPASVYQSERYGAMTYTVGNLAAGSAYTVRLHFAEVYFTAAGQRQFNVSIQGAQVLTNFDIFAAAGGANKAVVREFSATASGAGQIAMQFSVGAANNPKITAIEVLPVSAVASNAVNAGGGAAGTFAADAYFTGGAASTTPNTISTAGVTSPAPVAVYQSERWGASSYAMPGLTPGSAYTVRLHFAEFYFGATGQRLFNVLINGTQVLTNFDIVAAAGGANKAVVREFSATADAAGKITIQFAAGAANNPKISGIEIVAGSLPPPPPPPPSSFPAGLAVSAQLLGQNDWYNLPDAVWPRVGASGVKLVRIGGAAFDQTPLSNATLLHQVDQIRSFGAEPLVQVSRFAGATRAADMVRYLNITNNRNVRYWSIGNEPDLGYTGSEDQLAASVGAYIRSIAPPMRDVDASIVIFAPDMAWYSQTKYAALLGGAADITGKDSKGRYYVNGINFHRYPFGNNATRADVLNELHTGYPAAVNALLGLIGSANTKNGRTGTNALQWGLTEFNITYNNPATNNVAGVGTVSFLNGQFFSEYFALGMQKSAFGLNPWSVNEGGGNGSVGDLGYINGDPTTGSPRSSYYHMQMIGKNMLPGGYLATRSSVANMRAFATSTASQTRVALMILNEDTGTHSYTVRLDDAAVGGTGDTKINVSANRGVEYTGSITGQTSVVLQFDATGALRRRVTYSVGMAQNNQAPTTENF